MEDNTKVKLGVLYIILLPRSSSWHFRAALLQGNQAKCQPGDRRTSDTSFTSNGSWPGTERHCRLGIANSFNGIVIVIFQVMYPYALSISQYVSCFNLTTCSRWTFKIKTIYSVWAVCWTQGALNLPPILWLLLVDLPQPDRSSSDTLPPQLWDEETNFALCCVFFWWTMLTGWSISYKGSVTYTALWLGDGVDGSIPQNDWSLRGLAMEACWIEMQQMMTNALLLLLRSNRGETSYISDLFVSLICSL